jgi:hypothetical protein
MFGRTNATTARAEQGVFDLPAHHPFALVPSPYETGPAAAVVPRPDYNAGCRTLLELNKARRLPRCPLCGALLEFSSQDRVEGADYYECPEDGERIKWMWW